MSSPPLKKPKADSGRQADQAVDVDNEDASGDVEDQDQVKQAASFKGVRHSIRKK